MTTSAATLVKTRPARKPADPLLTKSARAVRAHFGNTQVHFMTRTDGTAWATDRYSMWQIPADALPYFLQAVPPTYNAADGFTLKMSRTKSPEWVSDFSPNADSVLPAAGIEFVPLAVAGDMNCSPECCEHRTACPRFLALVVPEHRAAVAVNVSLFGLLEEGDTLSMAADKLTGRGKGFSTICAPVLIHRGGDLVGLAMPTRVDEDRLEAMAATYVAPVQTETPSPAPARKARKRPASSPAPVVPVAGPVEPEPVAVETVPAPVVSFADVERGAPFPGLAPLQPDAPWARDTSPAPVEPAPATPVAGSPVPVEPVAGPVPAPVRLPLCDPSADIPLPAVPDRLRDYLDRLVFEPKRVYATELALAVIAGRDEPEAPAADWAGKVASKVRRLAAA